MVERGALFAMHDASYWLDAGTPPSYLQANTDVLDGRRRLACPGRAGWAPSLVDAGAAVAATATLERSVLGDRVVVEEGAVVRGSVVLDGARIAAHATVTDSVVGPGRPWARARRSARNCLVARGAQVPEGARLDGVPVAS